MAQIKNGHFGSFQGKIGAVTGRKRKGRFYISQSITHNSSNTNKQARARNRFGVATTFAAKLAGVVKKTYAGKDGDGKTSLNVFAGDIIRYALKPSTQTPTGVWTTELAMEKVVLSQGPVMGVTNIRPEYASGKLIVRFDAGKGEGALESDIANMVMVNRDNGEVITVMGFKEYSRSQEHVDASVPKHWADTEADVYIFLQAQESGKWSNSQYVGSITLSE